MNKKIITIAEIVFALIFVVLLALFMSTISSKGNSANTQLINTLETTGGTGLQSYDNNQMKGEAVISAIRSVKTLSDDAKIEIVVYTTKDTGGAAYGYVGGENKLESYDADSGDDHYINPSADFESHLIRNENDVVIAIHFSQLDSTSNEPGHECKDDNGEYKCKDYLGSSSSSGS